MQEASTFLSALFGEKPDDTYILIWTLPDKRSYWHESVEQAVEAVEANTGKNKDVYVGVALSPEKRGTGTRGLANETAGIVGLWADIDIESPVHKKMNLPPDEEAARSLLRMIGAQPTIVVHSGHGLQAWWLFKEPWIFENDDDRKAAAKLAEGWTNTLRAKAQIRNWDVDSTFDLSRVLRVPGSRNMKNKAHPQPVRIIEQNDDLRYNPDDLEQFIMDTVPAAPGKRTTKEQMDDVGPLKLDPGATPNFDKMELLREIEPKFVRTWDRTRTDFQDQSPSTYDLSLATFAAMAGWIDQEIVDLIIAARRKHGDDLKLRQDYYQRTIARAREAAKKLHAAEAIDELSSTADTGYQKPTPERRKAIIEHLSATFDIPLKRIVKYVADQPVYRLETEVGTITLGEVDNLIGQNPLRKKVAAACGRYIPKFKGDRWDKIAQVLLDACEEEELGEEATESGQAKAWLLDYLDERRPTPDPQEAVATKHPFYRDGRIYVFGQALRTWLSISQAERVTNKQMGGILRSFGCEPEAVYFQIDGKETTRNVWKTPFEAPKED